MDIKTNKFSKTQIIIICTSILVAMGFVIYLFINTTTKTSEPEIKLNSAQKNLEEASANAIKANLNLHYALLGRYPVSMSFFISDVKDHPSDYDNKISSENLQDNVNDLNNFNYTAKGDQSAYKFTYLSNSGKTVTIEGDYKNDYN